MVHATWRWRPASLVLTAALALAHVVGAVAAHPVPVYDSPLPSRIVVVRHPSPTTRCLALHSVAPC